MKKFIGKWCAPLILSATLLTGCAQKADVDTVNAVEAVEEESQSQSRSSILEEKLEKEAEEDAASETQETGVTFMDDIGRTVSVERHDRVIAMIGSFADIWLLAGGEVVGAANDA